MNDLEKTMAQHLRTIEENLEKSRALADRVTKEETKLAGLPAIGGALPWSWVRALGRSATSVSRNGLPQWLRERWARREFRVNLKPLYRAEDRAFKAFSRRTRP